MHFLQLIVNKMKQLWPKWHPAHGHCQWAANQQRYWHLIFKFLHTFYWGILIHCWLSFWFSALATARYDRFLGCPQLIWYKVSTTFCIRVNCVNYFVVTVWFRHNFRILTINGHNPINVNKNRHIYTHIHVEKLPKMYTKCQVGTLLYPRIPWLQKCTLFPWPGYIFGDICKPWTQFLSEFT